MTVTATRGSAPIMTSHLRIYVSAYASHGATSRSVIQKKRSPGPSAESLLSNDADRFSGRSAINYTKGTRGGHGCKRPRREGWTHGRDGGSVLFIGGVLRGGVLPQIQDVDPHVSRDG